MLWVIIGYNDSMSKDDLIRFSISADWELVKEFDEAIRREGYENRSFAIRYLLRDYLQRRKIEYPEVKGVFAIITYSKEPIVNYCNITLNLSLKNDNFLGICLKECTYSQAVNIVKEIRSIDSVKKCEIIVLDLKKW